MFHGFELRDLTQSASRFLNGFINLVGSASKAAMTITGQAAVNMQTLTDGATITWNMNQGNMATVTLAGNRTVAAPTGLINGGTYMLVVVQDATGTRTLTWNAVFKWSGGTTPTLTTTANKRDLFWFVSDGTNLYGTAAQNF